MKRILEFSEFDAQQMNKQWVNALDNNGQTIKVYSSSTDQSLSLDPISSQDRSNVASVNKLNQILSALKNDNKLYSFQTGHLHDILSLNKLIIQRLHFINEVELDVYISFMYGEAEYYGVIKKFNTQKPTLTTELFREAYLAKEAKIKIQGLLIKAIKKWLNVEHGYYQSLRDIEVYNMKTGNIMILPVNTTINVVTSNDNEIQFMYNDALYKIINKYYYYFNYYFSKI